MSKTVILYSGQVRTFDNCFFNQYWHVLRKFQNPEFYCCVANDEQAKHISLLHTRFSPQKVHIKVTDQPEFPESEWLEDKCLHSGYPRSSPVKSVLRAFWFYQEVWKMAKEDAFENQAVCVRIRPDLWFTDFNLPKNPVRSHDCYTVPWGSFSGINDRFAIMGHEAAEGYFTTLSKFMTLMEAGCPLHPETMTKESVEMVGGICHQTLLADYRTRRLANAEHDNKEWLAVDPIGAYEVLKASLTTNN